MTTQNNNTKPSIIVTMDKSNAKYAHQVNRATERNAIIDELLDAGVLPDSIQFRNLPAMFPIVELADLLALKLDGRENFKTGTVESFQNYGTAIQSLAVEGYKKATLTTTTNKTVAAQATSSDSLLKQAVLDAIEERLSDIRAYYLLCVDDLLSNPATWLADYSGKLDIVGMVSLESYQAPFDLPIDRINALLQSEKYSAQLETFEDELVCNKATNFRVHEMFLVCDGQPTEEQKTAIIAKGFTLHDKDTTALQAEITHAMAKQDFASVVKLSQELVTMQSTVEIRKALTE